MKSKTIESFKKIFTRLTDSRVFDFGKVPGLKVTLLRWCTVLGYGVLAGLSTHLLFVQLVQILPSWFFGFNFSPVVSVALYLAYGFIAALSVAYLQDRYYLRFRRSGLYINIGATLLYPTLHFSVVSGMLALVAIVSVTPDLKASLVQSSLVVFAGAFIAVYAVLQIGRNEKLSPENTKLANQGQLKQNTTIDLLNCDAKTFKDWFINEKSEDALDFFDRSPYVARIKERLESTDAGKRGQVLFGEFGSGKTSIINYVVSELDQEKWIVSAFDCWQRASKPEELVRLLMEQVIHDVGQEIEATSIENIPDAFVDALYGSHHWFKVMSGLLKPKQPEDVLSRLNSLLKIHDKKLLIVIENIDRNENPESLVNTISGVLDKLYLKNSNFDDGDNKIRFIFSGDKEKVPLDIVYRISDYKEHIETSMPPALILIFMARCISEGLSGSVNGVERIFPEFSKNMSVPESLLDQIEFIKKCFYLGDHPDYSPQHVHEGLPVNTQVLFAISSFLSNPRALKYILRRVYNIWISSPYPLAGEVNLFDLIVHEVADSNSSILDNIERLIKIGLEEIKGNPFTLEARKAWGESNIEKFGVASLDKDTLDSSSINKISCYLLNVGLGEGQNLRSNYYQPIILEDGFFGSDYRKYRRLVRRGAPSDQVSSDQPILKLLDRIVDGDSQGLDFLINGGFFDVYTDHLPSLLGMMVKNYWKSLDPLLSLIHQLVIYEGETDTVNFRYLRNDFFNVLFVNKNLFKDDYKSSFSSVIQHENINGEIHKMLEEDLSFLMSQGRYLDISDVLYCLVVDRGVDVFEVIAEPLIKVYYSYDMANMWAVSELAPNSNYELTKYFSIVVYLEKNKGARRQVGLDLWRLICDALLNIAYLNVGRGEAQGSFDRFFNGFGDEIRMGLFNKASQAGVKENLSKEALEVLSYLETINPNDSDQSD
jgi:hypothetical protein